VKINWTKIFIILSDVVLACYIVMAFVSFNRPDTSMATCREVNININDGESNGFIDAKVVKQRLEAASIYPIGKRMDNVSARGIEEKLRTTPFVKTAECYKTQGGQVYIDITQRLPVIRIKADNGDDYYVDDKSSIMPNSSYTSDLIIATGHISKSFATQYLSQVGKTLMENDLWRNLVEQIHVLPDNTVEIVPRIGNHIVYLGRLPDATDKAEREKAVDDFIKTKMSRLEKFYKYGLSHAGWNKYAVINLEIDNQIICKRRGAKAEMALQKADVASTATEQQTNKQEQQPNKTEQQQNNVATQSTKKSEKAPNTTSENKKKTT